jgi:SAM-dependent methyltransferase
MEETDKNWVDFWDQQSIMDDTSWNKNMEIFMTGSQSFFDFKEDDEVLDIGSGPGFLVHYIKEQVKSICCLDTSPAFVEEGNRKFGGDSHIQFFLLGDNYLDFSMLEGKQFSKIVCASVIQYYKDINEVNTLIREMKKYAQPSAQMLIVDIPLEAGIVKDLFGLLKTSWKQKYLTRILKFIVQSYTSEYAKIRKKTGLLTVRKEEIDRLIEDNHLTATWRSDVLTLNGARKHLLITF